MGDFTVGDLKRQIEGCPEDMELEFEGGMTFYRIKKRGDNLLVMEFGEAQAYLSPAFRKKHPDVFVAFFRPELTDDNIQEVGVPLL